MSTELSLSGNRWNYLGLLDDKVCDYPWSDTVNAAYLQAILRRSALFEEPALINDGYLLHYEWSRNELTGPTSLLRRLISKKEVVVFSRRKDGRLDSMVEDMSRSVKAYRTLKSRGDWSEAQGGRRPMRDLLREVSTSPGYYYVTWPDMKAFDNRKGFDAIINVLAGRAFADMALTSLSGDDFGGIVKEYERIRNKDEEISYRDPTKQARGARTVWEEIANTFSCGDTKRLTELMWLGNEVYHYNMALAVAGTTQTDISVSTFVSKRMCSEFVLESTPVDFGFDLPKAISSMTASDFVELVDSVSAEREYFRNSLRLHLRHPDEEELNRSLDAYSKAISEQCSRRFKQSAVNVPIGLVGTGAAGGGTVLGTLGLISATWNGVIAGIAAFLTSGIVPHLVAGWYGRQVSRQLQLNAHWSSTLPKTGTFELKPTRAKEHLERSK